MKSCNSGPTVSLCAKLTTALPSPRRIAPSIFTPNIPATTDGGGGGGGGSGSGAINGTLRAKYATFTILGLIIIQGDSR